MGRKRIRVEVGDVVAIPIDDNRYGFAQMIIGDYLLGCFIVFNLATSTIPPVSEIVEKPILCKQLANGYQIVHGIWKIVGNVSIPPNVIIPEYIVQHGYGDSAIMMVMDFHGNLLRPASAEEVIKLKPHEIYSPGLFEDAIKAKYGIIPWEKYYDDFFDKE